LFGGVAPTSRPRGVALTADVLLSPKDCHDDDDDCVANVNSDGVDNDEERDTVEADAVDTDTTTDTNTSLEIGFGSGDNLLTNAMHFPQRNYIGAEIHQPGVGIVLGRMEKAVQDGRYWEEQTLWQKDGTGSGGDIDDNSDEVATSDQLLDDDGSTAKLSSAAPRSKQPPPPKIPYDNVRIYPGDGMKLLQFLPTSSLNSIYLTHPDPWPKHGQSHWRVVQEETVREIGRVLKPGVGCFYLATDADCFDEWTRMVFGAVKERMEGMSVADGERRQVGGWEEVLPCPDRREWLPVVSRYEEKGMDEGRLTTVQCWRLLKS